MGTQWAGQGLITQGDKGWGGEGAGGCWGWKPLACTCTAMPAWGPGRKWWALLTRSSRMRLGRSCWCSLLATVRLGSATTQLASRVRACAFNAYTIIQTQTLGAVQMYLLGGCASIHDGSRATIHTWKSCSHIYLKTTPLYTFGRFANSKTEHSCYLQGMCHHAKSSSSAAIHVGTLVAGPTGLRLMTRQQGPRLPSLLIIVHTQGLFSHQHRRGLRSSLGPSVNQ